MAFIQVKFRIGQLVYFMNDASMTKGTIEKIVTITNRGRTEIEYNIKSWLGGSFDRAEKLLFETKEELAESLMKNL